MKARKWFALFAVLVGLTAAVIASDGVAGANAKIVGVWNGTSSNSYEFTMTLQEQDGKLQGNFQVQGTDLEMENLQYDGSKLSFNLNTQQGEYAMLATVDGNTMTGTFKGDSDSGTWKATRGQGTASN